ncbi:MAG TPA: nickel insertion protein [Nitrososphaerales archaeon]|nr:nickel insertion protein [Nitrososphaerales archaeon]
MSSTPTSSSSKGSGANDPFSDSSFRAGSTNLKASATKFEQDTVAVVETNVDDVTGEVLGRTIDRLISEGAYDATVSSYLAKKGRMGDTIRVVCQRDSFEKFAEILIEETGTLGVKVTEWTRLIVPRRQISVPIEIEGFRGNVSVKIADVNGRLRIKPEVSEAKQISDDQKIPLRDVLEVITETARKHIAKESSERVSETK